MALVAAYAALVLLLLTSAYAGARLARGGHGGAVPAGGGLVVVAMLWLLLNHPLEGTTLANFGHGHGLTTGDLLALLPVLLAVLLLRRHL